MLVFAGDLEQVEEVSCGGVDADHILVFCGLGVGEVGDFELARALWLCEPDSRERVHRSGGVDLP